MRGNSLYNTLPLFPVCLHVTPHWEKFFTVLMRLIICLNFRVFPIEATEAHLSIRNHQQRLFSPLITLPSDSLMICRIEIVFVNLLLANCFISTLEVLCGCSACYELWPMSYLGFSETSACLVVVLQSLFCKTGGNGQQGSLRHVPFLICFNVIMM